MKYMVTNLQTTINSNMMITVNDIGRGINIDLGTGIIPPIFIEKLYRGTLMSMFNCYPECSIPPLLQWSIRLPF